MSASVGWWKQPVPSEAAAKAIGVTIMHDERTISLTSKVHDLLWPMIVANASRMRTLTNGLAVFIGDCTDNYSEAFLSSAGIYPVRKRAAVMIGVPSLVIISNCAVVPPDSGICVRGRSRFRSNAAVLSSVCAWRLDNR